MLCCARDCLIVAGKARGKVRIRKIWLSLGLEVPGWTCVGEYGAKPPNPVVAPSWYLAGIFAGVSHSEGASATNTMRTAAVVWSATGF